MARKKITIKIPEGFGQSLAEKTYQFLKAYNLPTNGPLGGEIIGVLITDEDYELHFSNTWVSNIEHKIINHFTWFQKMFYSWGRKHKIQIERQQAYDSILKRHLELNFIPYLDLPALEPQKTRIITNVSYWGHRIRLTVQEAYIPLITEPYETTSS